MLSVLIFIIFLVKNMLLGDACASCVHKEASCRTSPGINLETNLQMNLQTSLVQELARNETVYQKMGASDSFLLQLPADSLKKVEELQKDPSFQEIVAELNRPLQKPGQIMKDRWVPTCQERTAEGKLPPSLYIFVSFSLGEKALLNLAQDAKQFGATLVLRGFKGGSYLKTVQALNKVILKTGQGVIIDPELYTLFNITAVPTFILARPFTLNTAERTQTPLHDKLQGHVSARYVLGVFAKEGDLKDEAQALLTEALLQKGATK